MEIKQLEYFIAAVESKSLNQAAKQLYTSQPNISKVISKLEDELKQKLLVRTAKGVQLTDLGNQVYDYAKGIMKSLYMMEEMAIHQKYKQLKIASYSSNMISRKLAEYYKLNQDDSIHIEFVSGSVEEVLENVGNHKSNIGILYYAVEQAQAFNQFLSRYQLNYHPLLQSNLALYAGPNCKYYNQERVSFEQLKELSFIQTPEDYFSLLSHLDKISHGEIKMSQLRHVIHSNSEHVMMNMLEHTDLCTLGVDFTNEVYFKNSKIHKIEIDFCCSCISVGYILRNAYEIKSFEVQFIEMLKQLFTGEV